MTTYVVAGATGHVGSIVAGLLLDAGDRVTAIVRDARRGEPLIRRGATLAEGSLEDQAFLEKTLQDADGVFTLVPSNPVSEEFMHAQQRIAAATAAAVAASGVPHVVMLSSIGADLPGGTGPIANLHALETRLRATSTQLTALRPSYFQENIAAVLPAAIRSGILPSFFASPDQPIPMTATRDIGRLAAAALRDPPASNESVDLIGVPYSMRQLAEKLSTLLGKTVQVINIAPSDQIAAMTQGGLSNAAAHAYAEMYAALGSGMIVPRGDRQVRASTTIDEILPELLARAGPRE